MNSIQNDGYGLEILVDGNVVEKVIYQNSNYYSLPQGTSFSLRLTNDHATRCDVLVYVSGKRAGTYRINPYSRVIISKYSPSGRPFVAFDLTKTDTEYRYSLHQPWGELDNLIQVRFVPEKNPPIINPQGYTTPDWLLYRHECSMYTDGVTPNNVNNRRCNLTTEDYERLINVGQYDHHIPERERKKYKMQTPLEETNKSGTREIVTRIIVDNDQARYRRDEAIWNDMIGATDPTRVPPRITLRHPNRPHACSTDSPFLLSRKYYFDSYP